MDLRDMKVLCYADRANFPGLPDSLRGKGGLPMSAWQITAAKQRLGSEQILFTRTFTPGKTVEGVRIMPVRPWNCFPFFSRHTEEPDSRLNTIFPPELFSLGLRQIPGRLLGYYFSKVIRSENPSVIHIHQPRRSNMPIIKAAMLSGVPVAVTLHGLGIAEKQWPGWSQSEADRIFDKTMIEFFNHHGVAITCVGEVIREKILSFLDISHPEDIYTTRNGVDLDVFRLFQPDVVRTRRNKLGIPDSARVISSVGTLDRRKNLEFLVHSISLLRQRSGKDVRCLIIGEGRLRGRLAHLIQDLGLEGTVMLLGKKEPPETAELLASSDVMALVSHSEALSRTIFEAMATGTPAVSFKDLFSDNFARSTGEGMALTVRGEPEEFADFLDLVLQKKWEKGKVSKIAEDYGWDNVGRDYLNILSKIAGKAGKQ